MPDAGREATVTVRTDDLQACFDEACVHLASWGLPDPAWLDRIREALTPPARDTIPEEAS